MTRNEPIDIGEYMKGKKPKGKKKAPWKPTGLQSVKTIAFVLPWPPSMNTYWRSFRGRNILSEAGRKYTIAASDALLVAGMPRFFGRCRVTIMLTPPDNRNGDCDNRLKPILDALVANGVIEADDYRIVRGITVDWSDEVPSKAGARVYVRIDPKP